jgi:phage baseplate assembly protein W
MNTIFDHPIDGFRRVQLLQGETLQQLALRELGDAARWVDIAHLNGLRPPYVTGDPAEASGTVALYGAVLLVPAATAEISADTDPDTVFGTDIRLLNGLPVIDDNGDVVMISGRANLSQAITHRIVTRPGELLFHPAYGCHVHRLKGDANGPAAALLGGEYVKAALRSDPRIQDAPSATVEAAGDALRIAAVATTIAGKRVDVVEVIP